MFRVVLVAVWKFFVVTLRRLVSGPRHAAWSFRFELFFEIARALVASNTRRALESGKFAALPAALLSAPVRREVTIEPRELAGCAALCFTPEGWTPEAPTILYVHGGGYISCSPWTHRDMIGHIARLSGARAVALDYRKAPAHPFPAAIDDCERAYEILLAEGVQPERLLIAGDSAGGGLCLALLQRNREGGRAQPCGAVLLSPWCDLGSKAPSLRDNARYDYLPASDLPTVAALYLGPEVQLNHPLASACYADLAGLPPLQVLIGELEVFHDDIERFVSVAQGAGTEVSVVRGDAMIHVWPVFGSYFPECREALQSIAQFVRERSGVAVLDQQRQ